MSKCSVHFIKDGMLAIKRVPIKSPHRRGLSDKHRDQDPNGWSHAIIREFKVPSFVWGKKKKEFQNYCVIEENCF